MNNVQQEYFTKEKLLKFEEWIPKYSFGLRISEQGSVVSIGDGIIWVDGLPSAAIDDILEVEDGSQAMVFHITENLIGAVLLKQTPKLIAGAVVTCSRQSLSIPVDNQQLGRVIDPLGAVLDEGGPIKYEEWREIDVLSPPIIERDFVSKPLYTGNKIVDNLIPIGKGQRQLVVGDNGLGKSSLCLDVVINQKDKNVICIYVLIGQKRSSVIDVIETLRSHGALEHTIIVVAEAAALAGLQYLAPFSGCAIAENWMRKGFDTIIVYDDLTTHAHIYRELSLLLHRPPGREAYPADIFYLHSRLLERSTALNTKLGGGTMTAFPIIETKEGEIATYIPTNLISITDGQIYFDAKLFAAGFFPAIDITKSVSRIGGKAQDEKIKKEAGRMKLDYLQFLELEVFTYFSTKLEPSMQIKIQRGRILRELLKQDRHELLTIEQQMAWLVAYNEGLFNDLPLDKVTEHLNELNEFIKSSNSALAMPRSNWISLVTNWFLVRKKNDKTLST